MRNEVKMTLYKIKYRFKKKGRNNEIVQFSESIVLDEETAKDFLGELRKFLKKLEKMPISGNAKVKRVKYFIKVYQLLDLSHSLKTISIDAVRDSRNGKGTIKLTTEALSTETLLDTDIEGTNSEQFSEQIKSINILEA